MLTDMDMIVGLDKLSAKINADFAKFVANTGLDAIDYNHQKERIRKFNSELQYTVGKKYIKFMSGNSCWGFVMLENDKKFMRGDILKPSTHKAPARNFARGNILNGDWSGVRWESAS